VFKVRHLRLVATTERPFTRNKQISSHKYT